MLLNSSIYFHKEEPVDYIVPEPVIEEVVPMDITPQPISVKVVEEPVVIEEPEIGMSDEDIELVALCTIAEAEGESEEGKRLVIDSILNRIESERFPDSVHGVLYQKNQYESMTNGRSKRCTVTDEVIQLVKEELTDRTNDKVLFFRTKHYHKFGTPLFQVGNHYFSSL